MSNHHDELNATLKKLTDKLNKELPEPTIDWRELDELSRFMLEGSGWRDWAEETAARYDGLPVEKLKTLIPHVQKAVKKFERGVEKAYQKSKWGSLPSWKFQFERLAAKPPAPKLADLNDVQKKEFKRALSRTWNAIGYDVLQANGGKDMKRDEVIEVVLDADHVSSYGELRDPVVKAFLKDGDLKEIEQLAKEEFRLSLYGM